MWAVGCGWPLRSAPWPQYGRGQRSSPQSLFGRKRPFLLNPVGSLTFLKGSFALHDLRGLGPAVTKLQQHLRYLLRVIPSCMAKRLVDLLISFLAEPDIFNAKALGFPCKRKGKRRRISSSAPFSRNCPEPKLTNLRGQNQRVLANVHSVLSQGAQDGVPVQNEGESQQRRKPIDILDIRDAQCTGIGNCCDVEKAFEKSTEQMAVIRREPWPEFFQQDSGVSRKDNGIKEDVGRDDAVLVTILQMRDGVHPPRNTAFVLQKALRVQSNRTLPTGVLCQIRYLVYR